MKLYRYCSREEYNKFVRGETLTNPNPEAPWFWFFPVEKMSLKQIKDNVYELRGIVTAEVLIIVNISDKLLTTRKCRYPKRGCGVKGINQLRLPDDFFTPPTEFRVEKTIPCYSKYNCVLIKSYRVARCSDVFKYKFKNLHRKECK